MGSQQVVHPQSGAPWLPNSSSAVQYLPMDLQAIQQALREQDFDAWLFYDHHRRDEIAYSVLGLPEMHVTRRWFYLIPAGSNVEPVKLNHRVEPRHLDTLPGVQQHYGSWRELHEKLAAILKPYRRIAMQYSPNNDIMYVSLVDGGMLELIRSFGVEVGIFRRSGLTL